MFSATYLKVLLMLTFGVSSAAESGQCPPTEKCECKVLGGEGKPHVFDVNCQEKKIKSLKSLADLQLLVGKPLLELDLKLNQLTDLPSEGFKGLKFKTLHKDMFPVLDLSSNPIKTINGDAFKGIKAATLELDLSNCTLEVFPKEAINKLPNLMSLQLKSNVFSSIPEQAFNRLKKLETIDLSGNRRLTLDENSFSGLETTVANVSLNDIGLTQFPADALKSLNKLQQLELDGNAITTLPAEIFKGFTTHTKKFRLSLRNNRMNFINSRAFADMGNLRLESLNLQGNRLTRLDFLIDPCSLSFTLGAFVKVRDNPINCDCDVYSAIVTEYTHVDGKCTEPLKYSGFWLNPTVDPRFHDEAAAECTDTNVTAVVTCDRDGIDSSVGLFSSLTVTLFSSLLSFMCVMAGL